MRKRKEERNGETKGERERERSIGTTCTCIMRKIHKQSCTHTQGELCMVMLIYSI